MFIGGIALSAAGIAAIVTGIIVRSSHNYELAYFIGEPWAAAVSLLPYLGAALLLAGALMLLVPIVKKRLAKRQPKPKKEKRPKTSTVPKPYIPGKTPVPSGPASPVRSPVPAKPAAPVVFCGNCGAKLPSGAQFCHECGNKIV